MIKKIMLRFKCMNCKKPTEYILCEECRKEFNLADEVEEE